MTIRTSGWLYTRGQQSVRFVREETAHRCRLSLYGPETESVTHDFENVAACMNRQAEIEQGLLAAGYQLAQSASDRRHEHGSWQGSDHRRPAS